MSNYRFSLQRHPNMDSRLITWYGLTYYQESPYSPCGRYGGEKYHDGDGGTVIHDGEAIIHKYAVKSKSITDDSLLSMDNPTLIRVICTYTYPMSRAIFDTNWAISGSNISISGIEMVEGETTFFEEGADSFTYEIRLHPYVRPSSFLTFTVNDSHTSGEIVISYVPIDYDHTLAELNLRLILNDGRRIDCLLYTSFNNINLNG